MKVFLVDYENVHSVGLTGIDALGENDEVVIFHTELADTVTFDMMHKIMFSKADIRYYKVRRGSKNALDFQLASYIGYLIGAYRDERAEFYMVSRDAGFDSIIDFWVSGNVNLKPHIRRFPSIKAALNYGRLSAAPVIPAIASAPAVQSAPAAEPAPAPISKPTPTPAPAPLAVSKPASAPVPKLAPAPKPAPFVAVAEPSASMPLPAFVVPVIAEDASTGVEVEAVVSDVLETPEVAEVEEAAETAKTVVVKKTPPTPKPRPQRPEIVKAEKAVKAAEVVEAVEVLPAIVPDAIEEIPLPPEPPLPKRINKKPVRKPKQAAEAVVIAETVIADETDVPIPEDVPESVAITVAEEKVLPQEEPITDYDSLDDISQKTADDILSEAANTHALYISAVKHFGQKRGTEIYHAIKPMFFARRK